MYAVFIQVTNQTEFFFVLWCIILSFLNVCEETHLKVSTG